MKVENFQAKVERLRYKLETIGANVEQLRSKVERINLIRQS